MPQLLEEINEVAFVPDTAILEIERDELPEFDNVTVLAADVVFTV